MLECGAMVKGLEVIKVDEGKFCWSTTAAGRHVGLQGVWTEAGMVEKQCSVDRHSPHRLGSPQLLA